MLDKELDAARKAQREFEAADADPSLRTAWTAMITAMENRRGAWLGWANPGRPPGSDMYFVMDLADKKQKADEARAALHIAADNSGYANCDDSVKWRY